MARKKKTPDQTKLFDLAGVPPEPDPSRLAEPKGRVWSEHKARLIQRYLRYFVFVTHHGTYVDGFAGPQDPSQADTWSARLVLESQPQWLRNFFLFELDPTRLALLERLRASQPQTPKRQIQVLGGDFNNRVHEILTIGTIKETEATFCLLDQWTFECEWATVEALAKHKRLGTKIELFYFLANLWLDRALKAATTREKKEQIRRWWGGSDWQSLGNMRRAERLERWMARLRGLGYKAVSSWPIYESAVSNRIMYYMIHATDHPLAPGLMRRAYNSAVRPPEPEEQLALELGSFGAGEPPN